MPINEYGFLGKDIKQYENELVTKYKEVFDFYEDINHFLYKMKYRIDVERNDFQGGIMIGLFSKSLTTFQAIYVLFRHYLCNNAEELCRILFEEMVNIGYCSLGKDEARRYLSLQVINKLKIVNLVNEEKNRKYLIKNYKEIFFKDKSYNEWKNKLINYLHKLEIKEIFDKNGKPKAISLEERIKKVNSKVIMNLYLTFYRIVSTGIHSSPEILPRYLITDENDLIKEIRWGPEAENNEITILFAAIHFMIIILEYLSNYFRIPEKKDIDYFFEKIKKLGRKYNYFLEEL
ncbi:MAG TPA: hypothetical protein DCK79_07460 [Candidatus Atribacteria bacterium]|nr:hypothetical protein [Candidatus Atribacteria bacterium]